ncbi:MAG: rRNA maturation RNase YbeY [Myxococcota bacterium]|jgi:probable rRNA maturation factor
MTARILSALGFEGAVVSMTFCSDPEIRVLNRGHRGLDRATDVLSFPQEHMSEGAFVKGSPASAGWLKNRGHSNPPLELGDIVISRDTLKRQAAEYGVTEDEELARLLIHGILHLLGWDHQKAAERKRMRGLEDELLTSFTD